MPADRVAIISCFFNVTRSVRLKANLNNFYDNLGAYKKALYTIEATPPGTRGTLGGLENYTLVHSKSVLWQKERLLNILVERLPDSVETVIWSDTDLFFKDPHWVDKVCERLQSTDVMQPFNSVEQYPSLGEPPIESFSKRICCNPECAELDFQGHGHTGYVWAIRRDILSQVGFFDECIIGGADHVMAHAFTDTPDSDCVTRLLGTESRLRQNFNRWADKIRSFRQGPLKFSYLPQSIVHQRHGSLKGRNYLLRNKLLTDSKFDPESHLDKNRWGCWEWNPRAFEQRQILEQYFLKRNEDEVVE